LLLIELALGSHGNELAGGHREGSCQQSRDAGHQHESRLDIRACNSHHESEIGKQAVVDPEHGRALFIQKCGVCHELAQAGTTAQVGPNLDDAFAASRSIGNDSDTVEGVVKAQVAFPREVNGDPRVSMPRDIVTGQDLDDVAAYVGEWAGVPGAAPPEVEGGPGAQVFANNGCGGCHTLKAAASGGVTGPDLDEVAKGYPPNVMPQNFEQTLSEKEVEDLVKYLSESTSGGKASAAD